MSFYEPLSEASWHWGGLESVEGLGDHEDVVNADTEEDEGNDGVGGGVEQPAQRAQAIAQHHAHKHAESTNMYLHMIQSSLLIFLTSWCLQWTARSSAPQSSSCWASGWRRRTRGCSPPQVCLRPWRSDPRSRQRTVSGCWHKRLGPGGTRPSGPAAQSDDPRARNCLRQSSPPGRLSRESSHRRCWLWCRIWPERESCEEAAHQLKIWEARNFWSACW